MHTPSMNRTHKAAAEEGLSGTAEAALGLHIAGVKLWFDLDYPDQFYEEIWSEDGVMTVLRNTAGSEAYREQLEAIIEGIKAMNTRSLEATPE